MGIQLWWRLRGGGKGWRAWGQHQEENTDSWGHSSPGSNAWNSGRTGHRVFIMWLWVGRVLRAECWWFCAASPPWKQSFPARFLATQAPVPFPQPGLLVTAGWGKFPILQSQSDKNILFGGGCCFVLAFRSSPGPLVPMHPQKHGRNLSHVTLFGPGENLKLPTNCLIEHAYSKPHKGPVWIAFHFPPVSLLMGAIKWPRGLRVLIFFCLKSASCWRDRSKAAFTFRGGWKRWLDLIGRVQRCYKRGICSWLCR